MSSESQRFDGLTTDLHPPFSAHEAAVEAERCYFCYDAPCVTACPTGIDIPLFIRQIHTGNPKGSAKTIFDENILGGMCARVCPTETLCEQACVRTSAENKPVKIGLLQRFATDHLMSTGRQPYQRAANSGKRIAVVGAGPAGLACAHRLSLYGHEIVIFDAGAKPGGLNEYGIASYKTVEQYSQKEVDYILSIGGIELRSGTRLGRDTDLGKLKSEFSAVFLGIGLQDVNGIEVPGSALPGTHSAIDFIAELRQATDPASVSIGDRVVVIGGGMTAIDAAVQAKMLGAEEVTLVYRRGPDRMNASKYEQELALTNGVVIKHYLQPVAIADKGEGRVASVKFESTQMVDGQLVGTGKTVELDADMVLWAIGQKFNVNPLGNVDLKLRDGLLSVDDEFRSSDQMVWAGGDCVDRGDDLTVTAVQHGKLAAESINKSLNG